MSPPPPYELLNELGRGASAIVYRARQTGLDRMVALKVVQVAGGTIDQLDLRLKREGKTLSRTRHPNLVEVFDVGELSGRPYIAMELVEGRTLAELMVVEPEKIQLRADAIFEAILGAVEALHQAELVHRDLKPANVMVARGGRPVVMDLGLVKDLAGGTVATEAGAMVGTPRYMAPEVLLGGSANLAADVWGLGCLYFAMHSGQTLFEATTLSDLFESIVSRPLPDLEMYCPRLSPSRRDLLARMLERDLDKRPPDARHLRLEWDACVATPRPSVDRRRPTPSAGLPPRPSAWARCSERSGPAALGVGLALLAITLAVLARAVKGPATGPSVSASASAIPGAAASSEVKKPDRQPTEYSAIDTTDRLPAPSPLPVSWRWRLVEHHRAALAAGGEPARRLARELAKTRTAPLGRNPEMWVRWIDIGRWLESRSAGVWKFRTVDLGPRTVELDLMFNPVVSGILQRPPLGILELALSAIYAYERSAFGWLMLGVYLELEHPDSLPKARAAFKEALGKSWPEAWGLRRDELWYALARALLVAPGHSIEKEWWGRMPDQDLGGAPLRGLAMALGGDDATLERVLQNAPVRLGNTAVHTIGLINWVRSERWDPKRARALLRALMAHTPLSLELQTFLFNDELNSGNSAAALRLSQTAQLGELRPVALYCELGKNAPEITLGSPGSTSYETRFRTRIDQLLERRDIAGAVRLLSETSDSAPVKLSHAHLRATMSVLGQGPSTSLEQQVASHLNGNIDESRRMELWGHLAGALTAPPAHKTMERLMATARGCPAVAKALWQCRHGDYGLATGPLEPPDQVPVVNATYQGMAMEVHTRPLFDAARGHRVPAPVIAHLETFPRLWTLPVMTRFLEAVRARRWADVAVEADVLMQADPRSAYWALALSWATRLAHPHVDHRALDARVRTAIRARCSYWALAQAP